MKKFNELDEGFICENCNKKSIHLNILQEIIALFAYIQNMLILTQEIEIIIVKGL